MTSLLLIGAGILGGIALTIRQLKKRRPVEDTVPLRGVIRYATVKKPKYTNPKRIGTRIDFTLQLWGTGKAKVKIQKIYATVAGTTDRNGITPYYERPLLGQNPISYNYIFHKGINVPFTVCAYVDDAEPTTIDANSLIVEITDTMGKKYLIEKAR